MVDFIGWNNHDWEVMRHYHAAEVVVRMYGQRTVGVEPHIEALRKAVEMSPESKIVQHSPNVAQGEWTATVGHAASAGARMATIARWRNGQIMEEYIFAKEIPEAEVRPTMASPMVSITTPNGVDIDHVAGVDLGWSCAVYGSERIMRTVSFMKRVEDRVVEKISFDEM